MNFAMRAKLKEQASRICKLIEDLMAHYETESVGRGGGEFRKLTFPKISMSKGKSSRSRCCESMYPQSAVFEITRNFPLICQSSGNQFHIVTIS